MNAKAILSVGLNQNWANNKDRCTAVEWLKVKFPVCPYSRKALHHIYALEGLMDVEKYATLSRMADDMRNELAAIRQNQADDENRAYQLAINLIVKKIEDIDIDSQAATSIMEMIHAAVLGAAELIRDPDDYQAAVDYANAILDGEN